MTTTTRTNPYAMLGEEVDNEAMTAEEMLEAGGANFTAIGCPTSYTTPNGVFVDEARLHVVRDDTDEVLGVHSQGYGIMQYRDVLSMATEFCDLTKGEAGVEHVGTLDNGAQFYATINLGEMEIDPEGIADRIARYLVVMSSHNGRWSVGMAESNFRFACTNQFPTISQRAKHGGGNHGFKAKHTSTVEERTQVLRAGMRLAERAGKVLVEQAEELLKMAATKDTVHQVHDKFFTPLAKANTDAGRTRVENRLNTLEQIFDSQTCSASVGKNMWAVYNAFTEYYDHYRQGGAESRAIAAVDPFSATAKGKANLGSMLLEMAH